MSKIEIENNENKSLYIAIFEIVNKKVPYPIGIF